MHGLTKPPARMKGEHKAGAAARVIALMKASNDPALKSAAWAVFRAAIENDPAPFMAAFGVAAPQKAKRAKSFTAIFTSPGKGPKREVAPSNPIGFQVKGAAPAPSKPIGFQPPKRDQTLSCVGFASKPVPVIEETATHNATHHEHDSDAADDTVRMRDDDMPADCWDTETGSFKARPIRQTQQKAAVKAWVSGELKRIKVDAPNR